MRMTPYLGVIYNRLHQTRPFFFRSLVARKTRPPVSCSTRFSDRGHSRALMLRLHKIQCLVVYYRTSGHSCSWNMLNFARAALPEHFGRGLLLCHRVVVNSKFLPVQVLGYLVTCVVLPYVASLIFTMACSQRLCPSRRARA
jgi:hypothetical protein